jgi:hypothetical protein
MPEPEYHPPIPQIHEDLVPDGLSGIFLRSVQSVDVRGRIAPVWYYRGHPFRIQGALSALTLPETRLSFGLLIGGSSNWQDSWLWTSRLGFKSLSPSYLLVPTPSAHRWRRRFRTE